MQSPAILHLVGMVRAFVVILFAIANVPSGLAQERGVGKLQGAVLDSASGEPIIDAVIRLPDLGLGVRTDVEGFFVIQPVPEGRYDIIIAHMHCSADTIHDVVIEAGRTTSVSVQLRENHGGPVSTPGAIYESENGWQRFWRRFAGRPRRYIGPG